MGNMTLSKLQMKQYEEIKQKFNETNKNSISITDEDDVRLKEVLTLLIQLGYIFDIELDNANIYMKKGDFKDFEKWHKDKVKEERKLSSREWKIAIISAITGAVIGLLPSIFQDFIPWIKTIIS